MDIPSLQVFFHIAMHFQSSYDGCRQVNGPYNNNNTDRVGYKWRTNKVRQVLLRLLSGNEIGDVSTRSFYIRFFKQKTKNIPKNEWSERFLIKKCERQEAFIDRKMKL